MPEAKYACKDDILCGVNQPNDAGNLSDAEKKHMPVVEAPDKVVRNEVFEVNVRVGGIDGVDHPNDPAHSIEWIELYCGDTFIGRCQFSGGTSYPVAKFKVKLSHAHGPLKAWAKCNMHGMWEGTKEITV